ncbi:MAG: hypothetical protein BroJett011_27600 [Chloroflexota bacterium]|nr:MAG: hypothetical protein BroJett011_27600 [Chloroflexota bacterium]
MQPLMAHLLGVRLHDLDGFLRFAPGGIQWPQFAGKADLFNDGSCLIQMNGGRLGFVGLRSQHGQRTHIRKVIAPVIPQRLSDTRGIFLSQVTITIGRYL